MSDPAIRRRIRQIPKVELHVHLEGSVTPAQLSLLSRRHGTDLARMSGDEIEGRFFSYPDFYGFLKSFKVVCQHLRSQQDYAEIYGDLATRLSKQNVLYAEILWTPSIAKRNGLDPALVFEALREASRQTRQEGPETAWIFDCVRQWGSQEAYETARMAADYAGRGAVAFSMGGDEAGCPAGELAGAFALARQAGLHVQAHAGESCGAESVWEALENWQIERISHACRAVEDPELIEHLCRSHTPIDVCLSSNVATGVVSDLNSHPFSEFFDRGLAVSLSTDDPGLFLTNLVNEYALAAELCNLTWQDLCRLVLNGVQASYLPPDRKAQMLDYFTKELRRLGLKPWPVARGPLSDSDR